MYLPVECNKVVEAEPLDVLPAPGTLVPVHRQGQGQEGEEVLEKRRINNYLQIPSSINFNLDTKFEAKLLKMA